MRIEDKLTAAQCTEIGRRIVDGFYRQLDGGTQFGVDWPTAWMIFPRSCRVFKRLQQRYQSCKSPVPGSGSG